ncbi:hypothetical protein F511_19101 [Dorcoceras hygrometricum]|uniref:Uncharacterized protein n=1 Tax=Dorcoceras hygrometricum TaxID=472368 RepID=A0A2Z7AUB9_9LAMI|nr:hypothetical protein F511_19101 [Dorcoceras hygrometricum]
MQHAIINAMKCMRAIKDRIARPVYQLENHLSQPLYPHGVSTGEIIGTTHQSASHNVAFNQVINQSVNMLKMYAWMPFINQYSMHTNHNSHGTAQPIEASQPFSFYGNHGIDSLEFESVPEYISTLKRGFNMARNHLPKSAQHPKNALPDFSRNLRTPAASRSIPQVIQHSLMGKNRKQREQYVADEEMSIDQTVQLLITDSSTVQSSRQQSQRNTTSANQNDIAPDTSANLFKALRYNRFIQSQNDVAQPTYRNLLSSDITMRYHSETTTHHLSCYSNYLKCTTTGFTERQRFYFKMPGNQISPKFETPNLKIRNLNFSILIDNTKVDFEFVLAMEHIGMVRMFNTVEDTGLKGFLEVSSSVYDSAVLEFFANAKVVAGMVVSLVANRKLALKKYVFSEAFGLPTEGMDSFLDIPTQKVVDMRRRFSGSNVPFRIPNKKKEMKMEYHLLDDIVAKALCAKGGSFDVVTSNKFDMIVAISAGLKGNLAQVLFQTLVVMVNMPTKKSQGFAVQSIRLMGTSNRLKQRRIRLRAMSNRLKMNQTKMQSRRLSDELKLVPPTLVQVVHFIASEPQEDRDDDNKLKEVQKGVVSLDSNVQSMDSRVVSLDSNVEELLNIQTFMKHDFGIYKRAFYEKMDTVAANVASYQKLLEKSLVHKFTVIQMQIASDLDSVNLQLSELVNHL